jgi:hypothetical protein
VRVRVKTLGHYGFATFLCIPAPSRLCVKLHPSSFRRCQFRQTFGARDVESFLTDGEKFRDSGRETCLKGGSSPDMSLRIRKSRIPLRRFENLSGIAVSGCPQARSSVNLTAQRLEPLRRAGEMSTSARLNHTSFTVTRTCDTFFLHWL